MICKLANGEKLHSELRHMRDIRNKEIFGGQGALTGNRHQSAIGCLNRDRINW
uniref:Uncharacterized protein n=1 Tax=Arundo donax TaxID=35708 RepID=A0A0A9BP84_ARUDO